MGKRFIEQRNEEINKAKEIIHQVDLDALAICLNDPEVMGRNTMGPERIARFLEKFHKTSMEIVSICNTDPERDYLIEKVDRKLREVLGDNAQPFEVRYKDLVKAPITVNRPTKVRGRKRGKR